MVPILLDDSIVVKWDYKLENNTYKCWLKMKENHN